jgi:DNA-binding FrmR family transcriptional regulator
MASNGTEYGQALQPAASSLTSPEVKEDIKRRMNRLTGQVAGIQRMVEEEAYCIDIIQQIAAVRGALGKVAGRLLEAHVNHCVYAAFESGSTRDQQEKIDELVAVFERSVKS